MKLRARCLTVLLAVCAVLVVGGVWATLVHAEQTTAEQTTYSGRAFAAFVNTPLTGPMFITDTGELPPGGGSISDALLDTRDLGLGTLDSVLIAEVLAASTSGASGVAESSASLANVVVLPGNAAQVTASLVRAESRATCAGVEGSTEVAEVTFGGQTIEAPPGGFPANTTVTLPGGAATLIINEQTTVSSGTYREIRVNAIHLIVPGVADVILSSAKSDINCVATTEPGPCHDFVTGGGFIPVGGGRANFGFNAGFKGGSPPDVHLNYIDHDIGAKMKATSVTAYTEGDSATSRHFEGSAEVNGVPGYTYSADVADTGEPGRGRDTFSIRWNGYSADGTLGGGNTQLHKSCQ